MSAGLPCRANFRAWIFDREGRENVEIISNVFNLFVLVIMALPVRHFSCARFCSGVMAFFRQGDCQWVNADPNNDLGNWPSAHFP